jgi:ribosomal protein S18 acetylase RimI-like enzyme
LGHFAIITEDIYLLPSDIYFRLLHRDDLTYLGASEFNMPRPKKPRLVESVNTLSIDEFVQRYVPARLRDLTISVPSPEGKVTEGQNNNAACLGYRQTYSIEICSSTSISQSDLDACFGLVKLTSSDTYKKSSTGWSPAKKKNEMRLPDMRYILLVRNERNTQEKSGQGAGKVEREIGGFLSFMVTYEDGVEVLYCYELHLAPLLQHIGLGKQLIGLYEEIGYNVGLGKGMLTVFKSNQPALRFYEKLGYSEDEFSPRPMKLRNGNIKDFDYMILSKSLTSVEMEQQEKFTDVVW